MRGGRGGWGGREARDRWVSAWQDGRVGGEIELSILRGQAQPLRLVDVVHRTLDFLVGVDVSDGRGEDGVAEGAHRRGELALDVLRDLLLGREDVVQIDLGHRRAHDIEHIRLDLLLGVGEAVVRILDGLLVVVDLVLHGHADQHEDVILGLGLAGDLHLLEAHRHLARCGFGFGLGPGPGLRSPW